jgi:hypothetical protein
MGSSGCELGNYPVFVVKAIRKEDVSAGVKFAQKHGLRLVVKNTGYVLNFSGRGGEFTKRGSIFSTWGNNANRQRS